MSPTAGRIDEELPAYIRKSLDRDVTSEAVLHELVQPLTAIRCFGAMALNQLESDTFDSDELRSALEQMIGASNLAAGIIAKLRDARKTQSSGHRPRDMSYFIEKAIATLSQPIQQKRIAIRQTAEPATVSVDPIQIQEVLITLLRNAIDATVPEDGSIEIEVLKLNQHVKVTVSDNGTGVHESDVDRLFRPISSQKEGGIGLGLAVAKTIIDSHGGRIWWAPNKPIGAKFQFVLPIVYAKPMPHIPSS